jgi:hypothetical protein
MVNEAGDEWCSLPAFSFETTGTVWLGGTFIKPS